MYPPPKGEGVSACRDAAGVSCFTTQAKMLGEGGSPLDAGPEGVAEGDWRMGSDPQPRSSLPGRGSTEEDPTKLTLPETTGRVDAWSKKYVSPRSRAA